MEVVAAKSADGPAIGAILSNWIDETRWMVRIHTPKQDIAHGGWLVDVCDVCVVRKNGAVQGFLARQGSDIQALYVAGDARGQGVGAALLNHAKTTVDGLELWTFQANNGARRFYERHGFTEDRRNDGSDNDEKLPDTHMIWQRGKK